VTLDNKIVSKVIFFKDSKFLLLERSEQLDSNKTPWAWDLPGGHVDDEEHPVAAAIREVKEETTLDVLELRLLGSDTNAGKETFFYICDEWSGDIELSHEHKSFIWVEQNELHVYWDSLGDMYSKMLLKSLWWIKT